MPMAKVLGVQKPTVIPEVRRKCSNDWNRSLQPTIFFLALHADWEGSVKETLIGGSNYSSLKLKPSPTCVRTGLPPRLAPFITLPEKDARLSHVS
ncbi:MAG: hypothetical protein WD425_11625 [Nitrospirales bacterium]